MTDDAPADTTRPGGWWWLAAAAIWISLAATAAPAGGGEEAATIRPVPGATYRNGAWSSFIIRGPAAADGAIRGWIEDPDGQWVGSPPCQVMPAESGAAEARLSLRPGRPGGLVRIETSPATGPGGPPTPVPGEVASTTPLLLVVGDLPAIEAATRLVAGEGRLPAVVRLDPAHDRIGTARDLDGYDTAVVCGSDVDRLSHESVAAIDGWVRQGGRLVFAAGESAISIAAADSPAAAWLPGERPQLVRLRRCGAIEAYARAGGLAARLPPAGIEVPRFEAPQPPSGVIDAFEGTTAAELPIVIRRAHGLGTVTWVGLDLEAAWCAAWPGCDRLLAALLGGRIERETAAAPPELSRRVPDLAGQLRVALDRFAATDSPSRPVPFEIIAGLGVLYAFALYPLDWWLVGRSSRPWLSWISLPLIAGGFTGLAWGVGSLWGRDAPAAAQVAEVIDIDAEGGLVRGSSWAAVRSPANARISLEVAADPRIAPGPVDAAVSWFADAGSGFGGLDALVAHPALAAGDYAYGSSLASLRGVPIAAASSRLFEARWTGQTAGLVAESTLVRDARGLLTGTVSHQLPFPLEQCWLIHAGWLYDVGRMAPGESYDTEKGRGPRSLAAALTRRTAKWETDRAERWEVGDTDVGRILELAGLHAAAGGSSYTSLEAGRLGRIDLSPLLTVDRAVLVGRAADARGTAWRLTLGAGEGGDGAPTADRELEPRPADSGSLIRIALPLPLTATEETP
jgi:hypothetical protein